jgi:radical SAM/Cys-rich protein
MKTLNRQQHTLSNTSTQLEVLNQPSAAGATLPAFTHKMASEGLFPLLPRGIDIFQMNLGKMCNQVCKHCHVDAGPDRKEIMTRQTMEQCLQALANTSISTVDLTGGAPEMNPDFRWLVEQVSKLGRKTIVRCNLTIIMANPRYSDLPQFYNVHKVEVVSSLPYFTASRTDAQRGNGVFEKSIQALQLLNQQGYGIEGTGLVLNLVYNPAGAFLPADQKSLEMDFRKKLESLYGIYFNNLFTITNLPISRYLDYLLASGNYDAYMQKLVNAFNPSAAQNVMCRNTLSIGWDGCLYDCDFNQMLELEVNCSANHISNFDIEALSKREIVLNQHCYGCTAGAGSSCGGATA